MTWLYIPSTLSNFVPEPECSAKASALDSQAANGKAIFGGGIIMSNAKAAELKAAELKAAELKAAVEPTEWRLSPRELQIVERLNKGMAHTESPITAPLFA